MIVLFNRTGVAQTIINLGKGLDSDGVKIGFVGITIRNETPSARLACKLSVSKQSVDSKYFNVKTNTGFNLANSVS